MSSLITSLTQLIFKPDKVDGAAVNIFKEFDFTLNDNHLLFNSRNVGSVGANTIVDLKWWDEIVNKDISKFRKECRKMLIVLIEKLLVWMAVSLPFLRSLLCVIPTNISDKVKKGRCTKQFQCLVHYLSGNSTFTTVVSGKTFKNRVCWFRPERKSESVVSLIARTDTWITSISISLIQMTCIKI